MLKKIDGRLKNKHTNETFDERMKNTRIRRVSEYQSAKKPISVKCIIHDFIWTSTPCNLYRQKGCVFCEKDAKRLKNDEVDKKLNGRNIKIIGNYINQQIKIDFQCLICNHIWSAKPNNILISKTGCPQCKVLKKEKMIWQLIKEHCQYDCFQTHKPFYFNNRKYYPDFYLENNGKKLIVEYNGKQHYEPVTFRNMTQKMAEFNYIQQIKRDEELKDYCKNNNIIFIEIPYYFGKKKLTEVLKEIKNLLA